MALPTELTAIKDSLAARRNRPGFSSGERALLHELERVDQFLGQSQVREILSEVTKMTGPATGVCKCCGR